MGQMILCPTDLDESMPIISIASARHETNLREGLKPGPWHGPPPPAGRVVSMRRKAFTLVELLVVVAVLTVCQELDGIANL